MSHKRKCTGIRENCGYLCIFYLRNAVVLHDHRSYVPYRHLMTGHNPVCPLECRSSFGCHLLDHLTADGACLACGEFTVVAVVEIYTNLP